MGSQGGAPLFGRGRLGMLCYHTVQVSQASPQAERGRENHQGQCKQLRVGNQRELNGPCNPASSSPWQMKWSCVSHLTSLLIFLIAEEGWRIIHHLANLSSSTTSRNTLLQIQISSHQKKPKKTQVTASWQPLSHTPPSLNTSLLHLERGKHPTSPNKQLWNLYRGILSLVSTKY